jgi:hypothetical protein
MKGNVSSYGLQVSTTMVMRQSKLVETANPIERLSGRAYS